MNFNQAPMTFPSMSNSVPQSSGGMGFLSGGMGQSSSMGINMGSNDGVEDVKRDTPLFQVFLKDTPLLGVKKDLSKDELNSILKEIDESLK